MGGGGGLQATDLRRRLASQRTKNNSRTSTNQSLDKRNDVDTLHCHEEATNIGGDVER